MDECGLSLSVYTINVGVGEFFCYLILMYHVCERSNLDPECDNAAAKFCFS